MNWRAFMGAFGVLAVLTPGMLWLGEWYPFSHFPMYAALSTRAFSLHVTDEHDRMLPTYPNFDVPSSMLKKIVVTQLRRYKDEGGYRRMLDIPAEGWEEAGREALKWLKENQPPRDPALAGKPLRLWANELKYEDGKVMRETRLLAEW